MGGAFDIVSGSPTLQNVRGTCTPVSPPPQMTPMTWYKKRKIGKGNPFLTEKRYKRNVVWGKPGRGRLQHFFPNLSYYLYKERQPKSISSERVICQLDVIRLWTSEVPHTCSFRAVNVLKQGVKCWNMPHITGLVATIPGDNCNTMSQNMQGID